MASIHGADWKDALDTQIEKLKDYHQHVAQIVGEEFSAEYDNICATLKKEVEKAHEAHFTFVLSIRSGFVRGEAQES